MTPWGRRLPTPCRLVAAGLALGAVPAGCDRIYGFHREARLRSAPDLECIGHVLATMAEIETVTRSHHSGDTAITLSGLKTPAYTSDQFSFYGRPGSHIAGNLRLHVDWAGVRTFSQYQQSFGGPMPPEYVQATRAVMLRIEQRVAAECDLPELPAAIRDDCTRVSCGAPAAPASAAH